MEEIAEHIVKKARTIPVDTGVEFDINGVRLAKVAVVGGFGLELTLPGGELLLFPFSRMWEAITAFVTSGWNHGTDLCNRVACVPVKHVSGHTITEFHRNCEKDIKRAKELIKSLLKEPPLYKGGVARDVKDTTLVDARGTSGWHPDATPVEDAKWEIDSLDSDGD